MTSRARRTAAAWVGGCVVAALVLAVPERPPQVADAPADARSFAWNRDALFRDLEAAYRDARAEGCGGAAATVPARLAALHADLDALAVPVDPEAPVLDTLEARYLALAPLVAACPGQLAAYAALYGRMRATLKRQSRGWDMGARATRERLYRALYGGRAAVEEVMLQHPDSAWALLDGVDEPSAAPSAVVHGVRIHSGDMLVSRGGAATSALIARGNDYPGNFSHVALVHVDSAGVASTVEAHIEVGVVISSAEQYLADRKLRIMVLRPRADLPALVADPLLPHRAATRAVARVRAGHVPYDFSMDYDDPSSLFCSEVASSAYRDEGVRLWMGVSTITDPGLRRWLASFGVRHFATQEPSDLEYDPQLVVVAEWRDPATLLRDHIDNAVTDVMLEGAARGDALRFAWYRLPPARLAKAVSWVLERFGRAGPVPEGMSASAALRNQAYTARHGALADTVVARAARLTAEQGYPPPYWSLLRLARQ